MTEWIETVGIVVASLTAIWGVIGWRKQMIAERKMGLAEEVLSAFYQARDIIEAVRSPATWGGEGRSWRDEIDDVEPRPEQGPIDAYYAPAERLNQHIEFFSRLEALQYRSQAVFGVPVGGHFAAIWSVRNRVKISSVTLAHRLYEQVYKDAPEMGEDLRNQMQSDIGWGIDDVENDPINQEVEAAVKGIESICRPALDEALSLWPWKWPT
jgi:hypothetical protein